MSNKTDYLTLPMK